MIVIKSNVHRRLLILLNDDNTNVNFHNHQKQILKDSCSLRVMATNESIEKNNDNI